MNKRNQLGLLLALLLLSATVEVEIKEIPASDTGDPNLEPNPEPNDDLNHEEEYGSGAADDDFDDFPVTYLSDLFRVREDERIDESAEPFAKRINKKADLARFIDEHEEAFDSIEANIGVIFKDLPENARDGFLDSLADYANMIKDENQEKMCDAYERRFEIS